MLSSLPLRDIIVRQILQGKSKKIDEWNDDAGD
jgi:hypothetical protein